MLICNHLVSCMKGANRPLEGCALGGASVVQGKLSRAGVPGMLNCIHSPFCIAEC